MNRPLTKIVYSFKKVQLACYTKFVVQDITDLSEGNS